MAQQGGFPTHDQRLLQVTWITWKRSPIPVPLSVITRHFFISPVQSAVYLFCVFMSVQRDSCFIFYSQAFWAVLKTKANWATLYFKSLYLAFISSMYTLIKCFIRHYNVVGFNCGHVFPNVQVLSKGQQISPGALYLL